MKIITIIKSILLVTTILLVNTNAFAYSPEDKEELCKKPRFTDFSLPVYAAPEQKEVAPESEFFFKISVWSDPSTLKLTAKQQALAYTVETTSTFHKIKAKLPAALTGSFVRLDASVKAVLGCGQQTGWLIKVADK